MTEPLRACPFCGCHDVWPVPAQSRSWQVECPLCNARGPVQAHALQTEDDAVAAWNRRTGDEAEEVAR
jgi:Lar family restriction alleviation protein